MVDIYGVDNVECFIRLECSTIENVVIYRTSERRFKSDLKRYNDYLDATYDYLLTDNNDMGIVDFLGYNLFSVNGTHFFKIYKV